VLYHTIYKQDDTNDWVTFIHGAGGSSSIWYKQLREFKKKFNVLLIDLRGHGKSKLPLYKQIKNYTFEIIGDEVMDVLDHNNIESTHFVGISLGTIVARDLTERYPSRTKSLVLGGAIMKLNIKSQIMLKSALVLKSVIPYLILYKILAFVIMPKKNHKESRNLFINEAKKLYQKEFIRWFALASQVNPLLRFFRIKYSNIPTMYIMGSEDHMFLPSITKLVKDHKNAILKVIPECGHVVNIEQPVIFNKTAIQFLQSNHY